MKSNGIVKYAHEQRRYVSSNIHALKFEPHRHGGQQAVQLAAWHTCTHLTQSGELQGPEGVAVAETCVQIGSGDCGSSSGSSNGDGHRP